MRKNIYVSLYIFETSKALERDCHETRLFERIGIMYYGSFKNASFRGGGGTPRGSRIKSSSTNGPNTKGRTTFFFVCSNR